ncbi:MAG: efflux RND transporter periplasmic adaptor subunit [Desulfobacterales bacterium]
MPTQTLKRMVWLFCIAAALTACKEKVEIADEVRPIKTMTVSEQAAAQTLKFSGQAAAVDSADLSFQVGGQVATVAVDIGDRVKKGQPLAVLDPEPYQLEVDAVQAELEKARDQVKESKSQYERQMRIYEQGAGVKSHLDIAEYNYKAAGSAVDFQVARLESVKRDLRKTKLLSPYDGVIAWRSVQPNEEVAAGQKVLEINATGNMEVQLAVPENTIGRIHIDDAVTITFPTLPGESTKGRISDIGSAAVQANSFPVKVALVEPNEKVKPGMSAEAIFSIKDDKRQAGYMIPIQAILPAPQANQGYAFVYDSQTSMVNKTPIRFTGAERKNPIVTDGLAAGDVIAVAGVSFLADGMKVKLMQQQGN